MNKEVADWENYTGVKYNHHHHTFVIYKGIQRMAGSEEEVSGGRVAFKDDYQITIFTVGKTGAVKQQQLRQKKKKK